MVSSITVVGRSANEGVAGGYFAVGRTTVDDVKTTFEGLIVVSGPSGRVVEGPKYSREVLVRSPLESDLSVDVLVGCTVEGTLCDGSGVVLIG